MPINGLTISEGATASFTGGTTKTYTSDGLAVTNGIHTIDASVTDFRTRPSNTHKTVPPKLLSDGSWTKGSVSVKHVRPKLLASGKQEFPNVEVIMRAHPENVQAEVDALRLAAAQLLMDSDTDAFWRTGSQA